MVAVLTGGQLEPSHRPGGGIDHPHAVGHHRQVRQPGSAPPAGRRRRRPWTARSGRPRSSSRQARNRRGGGPHRRRRQRAPPRPTPSSPAGRGQRAPATWASLSGPPRRCPGPEADHGPRHGAGRSRRRNPPTGRSTDGWSRRGAGGRAVAGEVTFDAHLDVLLVAVGAVLDVGLVDGEAAVLVHPGPNRCRQGDGDVLAGPVVADRRPGSALPHDRRPDRCADAVPARTPHETYWRDRIVAGPRTSRPHAARHDQRGRSPEDDPPRPHATDGIRAPGRTAALPHQSRDPRRLGPAMLLNGGHGLPGSVVTTIGFIGAQHRQPAGACWRSSRATTSSSATRCATGDAREPGERVGRPRLGGDGHRRGGGRDRGGREHPAQDAAAVPVAPLAGKVVIDTNNYYPQRDGHIAAGRGAHHGVATPPGPPALSHVVKAFNAQYAADRRTASRCSARRVAAALFGDDDQARRPSPP